MNKNYYPRLKSVLSICTLALSTSFLLSSETSFAQPVISSVSSASGIPGASITIGGSGFNSTATNNVVWFGATKATVTSASTTSLGVTVPVGSLFAPISVLNLGDNKTGYQQYPFMPEYDNSCFIQNAIHFKNRIDFSTGASSTAQSSPYIAAIGDLDGDGKPDMVTANRGSSKIMLFRNVSSGGVLSSSSFVAVDSQVANGRVSNVKIADLDGDGKLDVVAAIDNSLSIACFRNLSSVGSITFSTRQTFTAGSGGSPNLNEVIVADFDGDGKTDIGVAAANVDSVMVLLNTISSIPTTSFASGTSSFANRRSFHVGGSSIPLSLCTFDVDGDGKQDIVTSNYLTGTVSVLRNTTTTTGTVTFAAHADFTVGSGANIVEVLGGDINGDGKLDILVANTSSNKLSVLQNTTSGTTISFNSAVDFSTGATPVGLAVSDFDGDGKLDIVVTNSAASSISIFRNTHSGSSISTSSLASPVNYTVGGGPIGVNVGDFDGDKMPDIVVGNANSSSGNTISVLENYPLPYIDTIVGAVALCLGDTSIFSNTISGGVWSLANTTVATINPATGIVTPLTTGIDTVIYTLICNGDTNTVRKPFTVGAAPGTLTISGASALCVSNTLTLSASISGGAWGVTPTTSSFATVTSGGVVTGVASGTAVVTYTYANACGTVTASHTVAVSPASGSITGGPFNICSGASVTPGATTFGGTWTSSDYAIATINATTGVVTGGATGSATITYSAGGTCYAVATVNVATSPAPISGSAAVCYGLSTTLTDATASGTWSSSDGSIATIHPTTGLVYGITVGSAYITYTLTSTGCTSVWPFTVNALPAAISGPTVVCAGATISLSDATASGSWASSTTSVGTVGSTGAATATFFGTAAGTTTVTYTLSSSGCIATSTITVNPVPSAITGPSNVCVGQTITLANAISGGTWSSSNTSAATVGSTSGVVTGVGIPSTVIRYTLSSTSCFITRTITVNANPAAITGSTPICPGYNVTLSDATTGGGWTSSDVSIATIGASTGVVRGVSGGTATITYTLYATGCRSTVSQIIRPAPAPIIGTDSVCRGYTVMLTDTSTPYSTHPWSSSDTNIAKIDSVTGIVLGRVVGAVTISYTTGTYGCFTSVRFVVNPILTPGLTISMTSPTTTICAGDTVLYTANITNGGLTPTYQWKVNGLITGTGATFRYPPANGDVVRCKFVSSYPCAAPDSAVRTVTMTVNPMVTPRVTIGTLTGDTVCVGAHTLIVPTVANGGTSPTFLWKVNNITVWTGTSWTYVATDSDVVSVVMRTNAACPTVDTAVDTLILTVSPYVTPSVLASGHDTICEGYPAVFTAVPTHGGFSPVYHWTVNTVGVATGPSFAYMPTNGDAVNVTLTSSFPCVTSASALSPQHILTVVPTPTPSVVMHTYPGWIINPGGYVTLTLTLTNCGANPIYRWFKNGILIPGETTGIYITNDIVSNDSFVCRVTNTDLCENVTAFGYAILIVGENVGVNEVNLENANLSIAPNPNKGNFTIKGNIASNSNEDIDVEVTNVLGQVVYKRTVKSIYGTFDEQLNLDASLSSGMYLLGVHSEHISKTIRFSLER